MGWIGMLVGSYLGGQVGHLPGSIIGAILGHKVQDILFGKKGGRRSVPHSSSDRSLVFCASVAALLAKMAKADGVVTASEIAGVENAFQRLGFSPAARRYAVDVFRRAKDDTHAIYEYAGEFARAVDSIDVRELLYEILWDIACADGRISANELQILQRIPRALGIRPEWFGYFQARRMGRQDRQGPASRGDPLAEAYALLGATAGDGADELKRKYRELAKRNHPDALRAQGLPEEMIGKATERMSRINAAWATIREARGI